MKKKEKHINHFINNMPLIHSTSKKAIGENIAIERKHGKPEKQEIAIAFSEKREAEKHKGRSREKSLRKFK